MFASEPSWTGWAKKRARSIPPELFHPLRQFLHDPPPFRIAKIQPGADLVQAAAAAGTQPGSGIQGADFLARRFHRLIMSQFASSRQPVLNRDLTATPYH